MTQLATGSVDPDVAPPSGRKVSHSGTLRRLVRGKNISEKTLLATDYLNHFNEIIMMLEMVPMMADCFEDAKSWQPKSYSEHFLTSCFTDKELAVLAYENAPDRYRIPFDDTIEEMDRRVLRGLGQIQALILEGDSGALEVLVNDLCGGLRDLVDRASAIIHGHDDAIAAWESGQAASIAEPDPAEEEDLGPAPEEAAEISDQAAIDALFGD